MFSHVTLGTNDLAQAKTFYDALLATLGGPPGIVTPTRLVYRHNDSMLLVTLPIDGQPATPANGGTIGFAATSPEQVAAWHEAGVANGGTTCEDPPGLRPEFNLHLAYLRDPDGNKLCALHRVG
jgi:catechol 2,3-dioxygenase-like lactoylglutathione lyase family enzyme